MHRNAAKLTSGGRPASWLGVNFWSRTGGPLMWRNYDSEAIRAELRVLREHGLSMTRSFFYWPDFMPEPYRIDEEMTARFGDFLDRHARPGLATVPTFLVGHMSGENWDPAWRAGRELYSDVWMVAREAWFAAEMVRRFAGHEAVCGWLVSNEMPIYGGAAPRETIAAWAQIILSAVRGGRRHPASLPRRRRVGHRSQRARQRVLGRGQRTPVRLHRPARLPGRRRPSPPALRRGLGLRAGRDLRRASDPGGVRGELGLRVRHQRGPLLPAGAAQFAAGRRDRLDRLEQHRLRRPGRPGSLPAPRVRDALRPDRRAGHGQAAVGRDGGIRRRPWAGWVSGTASGPAATRPWSSRRTWTPSTRSPYEEDRTYLADVLRQAYVSARLADLPPALTRESTGIGQDARLYLVPSAKQLLEPHLASAGGAGRGRRGRLRLLLAGCPRRARRPLVRAAERHVRGAAPARLRRAHPDRG